MLLLPGDLVGMFELTQVSKTYRRRGQEVTAFSAPSLSISKGEYTAIVGPSGCGKTTLLSILGGMLSPDSGEVRFCGQSIYQLTVPQRAQLRRDRIGFVFQTFNLLPYLTAIENVQVPLFLAGHEKSEGRGIAATLLASVGLGNRLDHKPSELSTGQQQRVAVARMLANDPEVILADEPTGNLDPESRAQILSMFDDFVRDGKTIVMVTHDTAAATRSHRQLRLIDGHIASESLLKAVA
jgi:putative ABC transport system ATP-binding protein